MILRTLILAVLLLIALPAFAQAPTDVFELLSLIMRWISSIFPVLIGCIVVVIFWNLSQFVLHADDERERSKYKQFMIWSVVGMFLILSFWGIVYAITNSFFGSTENPLLENPRYMDKNGRIF
jgi:SNF family Na+-dependent transporter